MENFSTETTALYYYAGYLPHHVFLINYIREIVKWCVPAIGAWFICARDEDDVSVTAAKFAALMSVLEIDSLLMWDYRI